MKIEKSFQFVIQVAEKTKCNELSHRKGQYHTFSEPCPVMEELLNHIKILNKWLKEK